MEGFKICHMFLKKDLLFVFAGGGGGAHMMWAHKIGQCCRHKFVWPS